MKVSCRYESFIFRAVVGLEGHLLCDMWSEVRRCRATGCQQGLRENQLLQMTSRQICQPLLFVTLCLSLIQSARMQSDKLSHAHLCVPRIKNRLQSASVAIATKPVSCWCFFWGNQGPRKQRFLRRLTETGIKERQTRKSLRNVDLWCCWRDSNVL